MILMSDHPDLTGTVKNDILHLCRNIMESPAVTSACIYGSRVCGYARRDSDYDVLLILSDYSEGVRYYYPSTEKVHIACLLVDEELFGMDVSQGSLGEFVAGRLLSPYIPLTDPGYLREREIELKTRVILEELEDLVIQYGELSRGLVIQAEYIILSRMKKRMKVYPPLRYSYLNMFSGMLRERNFPRIAAGYDEALRRLEMRGLVKMEGKYITLTDLFIDNILRRKTIEKAVNILEFSQRAIHSYLAHGRAGRVSLDTVAKELTAKLGRELMVSTPNLRFEDPKQYLHLRTATRLVNLNEKSSVTEILEKFKPGMKVSVKPLGGALNEVYQAIAGDERFVIKRFSDWFGFKWFTLNLVVLGTKFFSVSGRARLANEYGMGSYLLDRRLPAQRLFYISVPERVLVKEYVKGTILSDVVRELNGSGQPLAEEVYRETGQFFANLHAEGIVLGDSKPENLIYSEGTIIPLDLEQAKKGGNRAWDIAEFLYYLGHYYGVTKEAMTVVTEHFAEGYTEEGHAAQLRKAAGLNCSKVFSFWTPPQIIHAIASTLKKT